MNNREPQKKKGTFEHWQSWYGEVLGHKPCRSRYTKGLRFKRIEMMRKILMDGGVLPLDARLK